MAGQDKVIEIDGEYFSPNISHVLRSSYPKFRGIDIYVGGETSAIIVSAMPLSMRTNLFGGFQCQRYLGHLSGMKIYAGFAHNLEIGFDF